MGDEGMEKESGGAERREDDARARVLRIVVVDVIVVVVAALLLCFVLFFVALAGLEAWFVLLANRTFSGVVTDNAYTVGLKYDDVLAQREAERKLGWSTDLSFVQQGGLAGRLTLVVTDRMAFPWTARMCGPPPSA